MGDFFDDKRIWILGGICAAAGVAIGLLLAPLTHGITITLWSNNAFGFGSGKNFSHSTTGGSSRHRLILNKNNSASERDSAGAVKKDKKRHDCCGKKH